MRAGLRPSWNLFSPAGVPYLHAGHRPVDWARRAGRQVFPPLKAACRAPRCGAINLGRQVRPI